MNFDELFLIEDLFFSYFQLPLGEQKLSENEPQVKIDEYMVEHRQTWQKLVEREHLDPQAFDYATWTFASRKIVVVFMTLVFFFFR